MPLRYTLYLLYGTVCKMMQWLKYNSNFTIVICFYEVTFTSKSRKKLCTVVHFFNRTPKRPSTEKICWYLKDIMKQARCHVPPPHPKWPGATAITGVQPILGGGGGSMCYGQHRSPVRGGGGGKSYGDNSSSYPHRQLDKSNLSS